MNIKFNTRALELAVTEYRVLLELGDPVTPAAFGIAVAHLQARLNLSLLVAAEMLRLEVNRLATLQKLAASDEAVDTAAAARRAEILLRLHERERDHVAAAVAKAAVDPAVAADPAATEAPEPSKPKAS